MSKEARSLHNLINTANCHLSNTSEDEPSEGTSLYLQDKELSEEESYYPISETSAAKIIALRLHHLELGQKKILHTLSGIHSVVKKERMEHKKKGR